MSEMDYGFDSEALQNSIMATEKMFEPSAKVKLDNKEKRDLEYWRSKFEMSKDRYEIDDFDKFELIYRGHHETTKNVNSQETGNIKKTNLVRNIVFELIESQVNTEIPRPIVKSLKPGFDNQAKMIQEKIKSDFNTLKLGKIVDSSERDTYTHGMSPLELGWNTVKGTHDYAGDKEFSLIHPKQFVPQNGVYSLEDMDYFFLVSQSTGEQIERIYGKEVDTISGEYDEYNHLVGHNPTEVDTAVDASDAETDDEKTTIITCYYKDVDGDVGKYSWTGDVELENYPKYYYPRVAECQECGFENEQDAEICQECGSEKLSEKIIKEEIFYNEKVLDPISFKKPSKRIEEGQDGSRTVKVDYIDDYIERIIPAGTKVQLPISKEYPMIIRLNVPLNFSIRGMSDVEVIRDQQETLKKVYSRMEEKLLMSPVIIGMHRDLQKEVSNDIYEVYTGSPDQLSSIFKHDLTASIQQDLGYVNQIYADAQSTLGITNSFQGKYDPSAKSGVAKKTQIEQAAGRLQSKIKNKFYFFEELFEKMFLFDIMFTKEARAYYTETENGSDEYKFFDKHELLVPDASGEWYYNTDFLFTSEVGEEEGIDRMLVFDMLMQMVNSKIIDPQSMWQVLAAINFPIAHKILEQFKNEDKEQEQFMMILEMIGSMDAQAREQFLAQPLEQQMQLVTQSLQTE
jgi:signal recognition particle GTPase